jgi:hypothetical protein
MASGKTAIKKDGPGVQSDTNTKAMAMGRNWPTRAMRNSKGSSGGSGGRGKKIIKLPPKGGWVSGPGGNC